MFRLTAVLLILFSTASDAFAREDPPPTRPVRVLILGASISWGCVGDCAEVQVEDGYVEQLRLLLPDYDFRVQAWFATGIADWDPESVPILEQSLQFPVGVWEEGLGWDVDLWNLMAVPQLAGWRPDYVIVMAGLGDVLRPFRSPSLPVTSQEDYKAGVVRLAREIARFGAKPVLTVDSPFASGITLADPILEGYRQSIGEVCAERRIRCGPDLMAAVDRDAHFVGTDAVHPNALGHAAIAQAFADWFAGESRPHRNHRPSFANGSHGEPRHHRGPAPIGPRD